MKFKNFLISLLAILLVITLGASYLMLTGRLPNPLEAKNKSTITATEVEQQIAKAADLSTAKLTYEGIVHFSEGQIKFLTKNSFSMTYTAEILAGIDLSKAQVNVRHPKNSNPGKVTITLPKAQVTSISISPDSLQFYDKQWALFNKTSDTDIQDALKKAEKDARQNFGKEKLLAAAEEQAKNVIQSFLQSVLPDNYELDFE